MRKGIFMIFAYFAPEVVLPVASAVAAVVGFILLVGRAPFRFAGTGLRAGVRGLKKIARKLNL
jgi:hypothetical protein